MQAMTAAEPGKQAAALLQWWRLAGVDHAVSNAPRNWLEAPVPKPAADRAMPVGEARPVAARRQPVPVAEPEPEEDWSAFGTWAELVAHLRAAWPLCPVLDGDPASGILLVGEAPSTEDLRTGRPFSGPAGQMLDRMLAAIGLDRSGCAIMLLAARRRIPGKPPPEAVARDLPLARRLITLLAPRHMLLMGKIPTDALGGSDQAFGAVRGRWLTVGGTPALATCNPAHLLHRPTAENKARAWAELLAFQARIAQGSGR